MNERDRLLRTAIFDEIDTERKRDEELWGHEFDNKNTPNDWVTFVIWYLSRMADVNPLRRDGGKGYSTHYRLNIIKAAVVIVAAIEAFDRAQGAVKRHYE
ncbi:hypothetical protein LCGC14_2157140 [marine sediment metagenome]|uniref:dATP/dGTP diphosphohydrolase N-terminal domain-containing protein n=1 Tax=marine sediment metagenome TaxID=412755 RepID=A0A0F9DTX3_9ZZZZ